MLIYSLLRCEIARKLNILCLKFFVLEMLFGTGLIIWFLFVYRHNSCLHDCNGSSLSNILSPCAVESHPTPGNSRGSSSPSRSISGASSHVADDGMSIDLHNSCLYD